MKKNITLTCLLLILTSLGISTSAQQPSPRTVASTRAETEFQRSNRELSNALTKLTANSKLTRDVLDASKRKDIAKLEAILKEAGLRDFKVELTPSAEPTHFTISICVGVIIQVCASWEIDITITSK